MVYGIQSPWESFNQLMIYKKTFKISHKSKVIKRFFVNISVTLILSELSFFHDIMFDLRGAKRVIRIISYIYIKQGTQIHDSFLFYDMP